MHVHSSTYDFPKGHPQTLQCGFKAKKARNPRGPQQNNAKLWTDTRYTNPLHGRQNCSMYRKKTLKNLTLRTIVLSKSLQLIFSQFLSKLSLLLQTYINTWNSVLP